MWKWSIRTEPKSLIFSYLIQMRHKGYRSKFYRKYLLKGVAGKEKLYSYAVICFILQLNNKSICVIGGFIKEIIFWQFKYHYYCSSFFYFFYSYCSIFIAGTLFSAFCSYFLIGFYSFPSIKVPSFLETLKKYLGLSTPSSPSVSITLLVLIKN